MIKFLLFILFIAAVSNAQTDWVKWEAKSVSYELKSVNNPDYNAPSKKNIISAVRSAYKFIFSDLDGDNCPFYPSCSKFFADAVGETNILKGTLMFVDRFTRDINFFKGMNHYPKLPSGKFFDPSYNYTMNEQNIDFTIPQTSSK